jgi:hypothetical protein
VTHFLATLAEMRCDPLARRWFWRIAVGVPFVGLLFLLRALWVLEF